jgi:hypothetical protein
MDDDLREEHSHHARRNGASARGRVVAKVAATWIVGAILAVPVAAGESGHWKGKAVFVVTSSKTVKLADQADHQAGIEEYDGVVFSMGDTAFLDNARYQVVAIWDTAGLVQGGYKTFTAEDGVVHMQYKVTGGSWPKFQGEWTVISGTKRYNGITGSGTFNANYVSDTVAWDILEGDYNIP